MDKLVIKRPYKNNILIISPSKMKYFRRNSGPEYIKNKEIKEIAMIN